MKRKIILLILLLLNVVVASTAAAFLENGAAARSEAMGRAFTAVSDDLDAFYYNPAGYAFQNSVRVNTLSTRVNNLQDVFSGGVGLPLGRGYLALNAYTAYIGDIKAAAYVSGASNQDYIQETGESFSLNSSAFYLSYALGLENFSQKLAGFSLGLNLKQISETLYENSAQGSGLDFGLMYRFEAFSFGYTMVNFIEPQMAWNTDSGHVDAVERFQRTGAAYNFAGKLIISGEILIKKFETLAGLGLEYLVNDYFALRTGSFNENYAIGFGFNYSGFNFDYTYLRPTEELRENTHKFSLGYLFEPRPATPPIKKEPSRESKPAGEKPAIIPVKALEEQTAEALVAAEEKLFAENFPEIAEVITLEKKNFILTEDKIKCFYKIVNNATEQLKLKYTIMLIDSRGQTVDTKTSELIFAPASTDLLNEQLAVGLTLPRGEYKIKAFFRWHDSQMLTDLETIQKK